MLGLSLGMSHLGSSSTAADVCSEGGPEKWELDAQGLAGKELGIVVVKFYIAPAPGQELPPPLLS